MANHPTPAYLGRKIGNQYPALRENIKNTLDEQTIRQLTENLTNMLHTHVSEQDSLNLLTLHLLTQPILHILYPQGSENIITQLLTPITDSLQPLLKENQELFDRTHQLQRFAQKALTPEDRQNLVRDFLENLINTSQRKQQEKLGVVYTPTIIVDWIEHAVDRLLEENFNQHIGDRNIQILDPFTGTGTFITRLLTNNLILTENLAYKYEHDIHLMEIMPISYYLSLLTIGNEYTSLTGEQASFTGGQLGDTFTTDYETKPQVIVSNPPYSGGQHNANDDNPNDKYPLLDEKIKRTYLTENNRQVHARHLYDSYVRAFRWASDQLDEHGVIGFITNGGWVRNLSFNGFREALHKEFTDVYVLDLRGNKDFYRLTRAQLQAEGGNVFNQGSKTSIAITLLVRNPNKTQHTIHYHDIGEHLTTREKLQTLADTMENPIHSIHWETIQPDQYNDWLDQRNSNYSQLLPLAMNKLKQPTGAFNTWSTGYTTGRDAYSYDYSKHELKQNIQRLCNTYQESVNQGKRIIDRTRIDWTRPLIHAWETKTPLDYQPQAAREALYQPFSRKWLYYGPMLLDRASNMNQLFPPELENQDANIIIDAGAQGNRAYSVIASSIPVDGCVTNRGVCFPLYWYEKLQEPCLHYEDDKTIMASDGTVFIRHYAITNQTLAVFQKTYPWESILHEDTGRAKKAIFHYVYGVLNTPEYYETYKSNLTKQNPRIPLVRNFQAYETMGAWLLDLHAHYENVDPWTLIRETWNGARDYTIHDRLRFAKNGRQDDRSRIIINPSLTLENIPPEAYEWTVRGRSPIEWVMNQYQRKTDKNSGNLRDPNQWGIEHGNPRYVVDLLEKLVTVAIKTTLLLDHAPSLDPLPHIIDWPTEWDIAE